LAVRRLNFRRDDGVAMTEFALILPIFMVIVAGLLGFGRVFFYWIQANHVANETARWAAVDHNPFQTGCPSGPYTGAVGCQSLQQHGANSASREFNDGAEQTTVCIALQGTRQPGEPLKVTVAKPFTFVPILNIGTITIRASSTMRIEHLGGEDTSKDPPTPIPVAYAEGCGT
jgi:Flp pilus assembly protein TadG